MLTTLIAIASAAPTCDDLGSERFRSLVIDSQSAMDRGDLTLLRTVLSEIERDIPCLNFAPPPRQWADLMVVEAVANFAEGGDWKSPLQAALRIRPGIDRGVGRSHPIYDWEPPEPRPGVPYEGSGALYVDGRISTVRPPSTGWYLVQKTDGEYWNTRWQRETPVSTDWILSPVDRPAEVFWQAALGLQGGATHVMQDTERQLSSGSWTRYGSRYYDVGGPLDRSGTPFVQPAWGIVVKGRLTYQHLGFSLGGSVLWNRAPGMRDGYVSAVYDTPRIMVGAGVSAHDIFLIRRPGPTEPRELIAESDTHLERFYHLHTALRARGRMMRAELNLLGGLHTLHTYNGLMDLTFTFDGLEILGARPQLGGQAAFAMGRFLWADGDGLRLNSTSLRLTTHVTLLFGSKYR